MPSAAPNIYASRGRFVLSRYHAQQQQEAIPDYKLSTMKSHFHNPKPTAELPICIIGAGMAGLYAAMILQSLKIPYQIVDAGTRERVGGRVFTHRFEGGDSPNYYDVGAMRFPRIPFMKRTFDLAEKRGLPVKFIPYVMTMPNTFMCYNNISIRNQDIPKTGDPFKVLQYVKDSELTTPDGVTDRVTAMIKPFRDLFTTDPGVNTEEKMKALFTETDRYSMRGFMIDPKGLDMRPEAVNWCETLDNSTAGYDRALTEYVLDSLAFDWPTESPSSEPEDPNKLWHCFEGGSSRLSEAMFNSLPESVRNAVQFKSPVTAISEDPQTHRMNISIDEIPSPQSYSAVISTVPLPCLSLMDLTGANIHNSYAQWSAIRQLQYGASTKIGLKFSCPWWETKLEKPIHGGQSRTDLPLRTIVYPSYPANVPPEQRSSTLIVSYCWTQDAERMGALINDDGTVKPRLIHLIFRDLATVHGVTVEWLKQYYDPKDPSACFAWDWLHDPLTMGAFALFGPGVYGSEDVYSKLLLPAATGKLFFAGEAASTCHAWIAGALGSAWRAIDQYLDLNDDQLPGVREEFWKKWGRTEYLDEDKLWEKRDEDKLSEKRGGTEYSDEVSDDGSVGWGQELMERHHVIALYKSGVAV